VACGGTRWSGDAGDEWHEAGSCRLRARAGGGGLGASMEARARWRAGLWHPWRCEIAVSVVGAKATTAAIAYELHPLDLEVSCSILDNPV
jgi:hypothetical protein